MVDAVKFDQRPVSRPLSEISENEDLLRMGARVSSYSSISLKGDRHSRPTSEVLDDTARVALTLPVHTITLNLADYGGPTTASKDKDTKPQTQAHAAMASPAAQATSSPAMSSNAARSRKTPSPAGPEKQPADHQTFEPDHNNESAPAEHLEDVVDLTKEDDDEGVSPLLISARAALRSTQQGASSSPPSTASLGSARSSLDLGSSKPATKAKPRWLRRASMTPSLRSKSRSPATSFIDLPQEPSSPRSSISTNTPPMLPPRRFPVGAGDGPVAGPSCPPPQHPAREAVQAQAQAQAQAQSQGIGRRWRTTSITRSSSNNSLASTASSVQQRFPQSATRVLGHAGKAVSNTWNRARGVGSSRSISGLAALNPVRGVEPSATSPRSLSRKLSPDDPMLFMTPGEIVFAPEVVKRPGRDGFLKRVFGRDLSSVGRAWGVYDSSEERIDEDEYHRRRRQCLPAVVIRCVDYLSTVALEEEGIFRISGRSSHLARLRREFDSGADLDLNLVHPSDLDPHAIAGTFKSYLRELPEAMIPPHLEHKIEEYIMRGTNDVDELEKLVGELPSSNWFLLADVVRLIELIPKSIEVNRMSHQALMLSLGPTLRLSGDHVKLFVRHRERLFAHPPAVSPRELVDFGEEVEIPPLSPIQADGNLPSISVPPGSKNRPAPKVSKRPSFSNLLSGARSGAMRKSQSDHGLLSSTASSYKAPPTTAMATGPVTSDVAPRLTLPDGIEEAQPLVEGDPDETEELKSIEHGRSSPARARDSLDDHQYAPGTVASRSRMYSGTTPIADRFQRSSLNLDRSAHVSSLSMSSSSSLASSTGHVSDAQPPINPMPSIRRSPPIFFSSAVSSTSTGSQASSKGVKRKDDAGAERAREGDDARDPAKRLSAGPGVLTGVTDEAMVTA